MKKEFKLIATEIDGNVSISGFNDGFTILELITLLGAKKLDLYEQLMHPEKFKHTRTAIVDGEQISIEEVDDQ